MIPFSLFSSNLKLNLEFVNLKDVLELFTIQCCMYQSTRYWIVLHVFKLYIKGIILCVPLSNLPFTLSITIGGFTLSDSNELILSVMQNSMELIYQFSPVDTLQAISNFLILKSITMNITIKFLGRLYEFQISSLSLCLVFELFMMSFGAQNFSF